MECADAAMVGYILFRELGNVDQSSGSIDGRTGLSMDVSLGFSVPVECSTPAGLVKS